MSRFASIFGNARSVIRAVHGTGGIVYTSQVLGELSITAIIGAESAELLERLGGREDARARTVQVPTDIVTTRRRGDTIALPAEGSGTLQTWTVHEELAVENGYARLLVWRIERLNAAGRRL